MTRNRFALYLCGLVPAGLFVAYATANNAGHAHHNDTQPTTQPTSKPTADTVEHYPAPPAPNLIAAEELATFQLPPGYKIELVASEPQVQDPVALCFDADGRMWVAEMRGYMPDVYAHHEEAPIGRVSVLEQTKTGGPYDKATVFMDNLYLPRAVSPVDGGIMIASPPNLWFCRDNNGDLQCDKKVEISAKYGMGRDPEYGDNGLLWARDNWLYSSTSSVRFRYLGNDKFESSATGHRGQWGISQDDVGRLYFNGNSDQLRGDMIPTEYLKRNPNYNSGGANFSVETDQRTWSRRPNPGINRGYEPGNLRDGRLATVTACCGPSIFRGTALGEDAYGNAFIPEPAGNMVMRKTLTETDGVVKSTGVYYQPDKDQPKLDFLTSTDERFRPVNTFTAPDGSLYIVDMYRGVIQHKTYVTPYLRHQVFERGLEQPLHEGRIWRIVKDGAKLTPLPKMSTETPEQLVEHLADPNGWWRDTAQRLLVERSLALVPPPNPDNTTPADNSAPVAQLDKAVSLLRKMATGSPVPIARLHALWTLSGMNKLDPATIVAGLHDKDARVCAAAIRLSEPLLSDKDGKILGDVLALKARADARLQFVLSVSAVKSDKVDEALSAILANSADAPFLKDAAISGMAGRELDFLQFLLTDPAWEKASPGRTAILNALASATFREAKPAIVAQLLETATLEKGTTQWRQTAILGGITAINKGQSKPGKVKLAAIPEAFLRLTDDKDAVTANLAKAAEAFILWPGKKVIEKQVTPLTPPQKESFARGKVLFGTICAQCHQPDGRGFEGKAPSLRDSPIALGPDIRLIRIVLNGAKGEYHVAGWSPNLEMPTLAVLEDGQIADLLTYVRHEWDHDAPPVEAATVAKIRTEVGGRQAAWTEPELLAVPVPKAPATQPAATAAKEK